VQVREKDERELFAYTITLQNSCPFYEFAVCSEGDGWKLAIQGNTVSV
jgi:hypothetical protein